MYVSKVTATDLADMILEAEDGEKYVMVFWILVYGIIVVILGHHWLNR